MTGRARALLGWLLEDPEQRRLVRQRSLEWYKVDGSTRTRVRNDDVAALTSGGLVEAPRPWTEYHISTWGRIVFEGS